MIRLFPCDILRFLVVWSALFLLQTVFTTQPVQAEAVNWRENRLTPLTRLTVGPWDNFEGTVSPEDTALFYVRQSNQVPKIYRRELLRTDEKLLSSLDGDAKDPVLDGEGGRLAITFFGRDAQGDVCVVTLADGSLDCLTTSETVDEAPFWIDDDHLGFLSRVATEPVWQLISYDLTARSSTVLYRGMISAPVASPDMHFIFFNEAEASGVSIHGLDLIKGTTLIPPPFDLPGITGFMAFFRGGRDLYFNHYLNDTNGDQVIDGSDHSVAYRISVDQWLSATDPILPEQLTAVDTNCKFPAVTSSNLYLTCAFGGSLDIYRLPLTGAVPPEWIESQLWEAHEAARSYEERLLILNTLRYRHGLGGTEMLERILSNHLEIGELSAASFYGEQLSTWYKEQGNEDLANFHQVLNLILKVRSAKRKVPVGLVTARFEHQVAETRQKISGVQGRVNLIALAEAYLAEELDDHAGAQAALKKMDLVGAMLPMERYLTIELYRRILDGDAPAQLLELYPLVFNAPEMSLATRLYYAFLYLENLERVEVDPAKRIAKLGGQIERAGDSPIADLLRSEGLSVQLGQAEDQKEQTIIFKELSILLKANQDNLLVRRAMHTRAIRILGEAGRFQFMELLSRHWLMTTPMVQMEFYHVARQYALITMGKGYGLLAEGEPAKAYATFYSAIRQTNDLEAHYQFVRLGLDPSLEKRENLDKSYPLLEQEGLIGGNRNYVAALRLVIEGGADSKEQDAIFDKALDLLGNMDMEGLNPGMWHLLMGAINHRKLRDSVSGYRYDKELFQKAHYHFMMAYDQARGNERILASVWDNLGRLHFEVRNYALSATFFEQRMHLQFSDPGTEGATRWAYARSLFFINDMTGAQVQAEAALAAARLVEGTDPTPFLEKAAFHAMQAGAYASAAKRYEELLNDPEHLTGVNRAKALLAYGFSLKQLGEIGKARGVLTALLEITADLRGEPVNAERLIGFFPERLEVLANGFLAGLVEDPKEQAAYRLQRVAYWEQMAGRASELAMDESGLLSALAKDAQLSAIGLEKAGEIEQSAEAMDRSLAAALALVKETGDPNGPVIFRVLVNYLSMGLTHPEAYAQRNPARLGQACSETVQALKGLPYRPAVRVAQQAKLELLWTAYQDIVLGMEGDPLKTRLERVMDELKIKGLQSTAPSLYHEIIELVAGLLLGA
ncbi:MAG: hypothetical protein KJ950_13295 [Proteobacteria bacterium]|nr:hypothetical protein [Pseudomonadota bacterium]MBU1686150.1 hypothetical protein [Pseudomonadota bacterium]